MNQRAVDDGRALRFAWWGQLQARGGPTDVSPSVLRELRVYGGQRGIWVDKPRTGQLTADGAGVVVALLHTGFYDDDFTEIDLIYRYPKTETPGWDAAQVVATKNAAALGIPVFVISSAAGGVSGKTVRLGWIHGWDDCAAQFLVVFGEEPPALQQLPNDNDPFVPTQRVPSSVGTSKRRVGQARFRFDVLRRCGPRCAMCDIGVLQVLETPHVIPVADFGTNDPRNGMVMCATHHRAYDGYLFGIEPRSLNVHFTPRGPKAAELHITIDSLTRLPTLPHDDALGWRWDRWRQRVKA